MIATSPRPKTRPPEKPRPKRQDLLKEILTLRREVEALQRKKQNFEIHPQLTREVEAGATWSWADDPYSGPFALFLPGQLSRLQDDIVRPEGRIHWADEHTSAYGGRWITGAVESGVRTAWKVHYAP